MGWVEKNTGIDLTIDELSKPVNQVLQPVEEAIKDAGRDIDDFVNDNIPGGWVTVAALAGGAYYGVPGFGTEGLAAGDAAFLAADASQLAAQGLSTAQISSTLTYAGVPAGLAESVATLAGMGLPEAEIIANIGNTIPLSQVGSSSGFGVTDALKTANQIASLTGSSQQTPTGGQAPQQIGQSSPTGVDYSDLLGLLKKQPQLTTGLLGTQFLPQSENLAALDARQKLLSLLG